MIGGGNDEFSTPNPIVNSHLRLLSMNNNRIQNLDQLLQHLSVSFPNLAYLSLLGNPCCPDNLTSSKLTVLNQFVGLNYHNYRKKCCQMLPNLQFLDSARIERETVNRDANKEENQFGLVLDKLNRIRNLFQEFALQEEDEQILYCSPLPDTGREAGQHRGAYGKKRFRYLGDNSEGNRFIFNKDL